MTIKSIRITREQRDRLIEAEGSESDCGEMRISLIEDHFLPSDCAYENADGSFDIDESAYIYAERKGFVW